MGAFIFSYAQIPAVFASPVTQASTVMRTFEERVTLEHARTQVLTLTMRGYIFFGSSVIQSHALRVLCKHAHMPRAFFDV
jgi:hypothetical protein